MLWMGPSALVNVMSMNNWVGSYEVFSWVFLLCVRPTTTYMCDRYHFGNRPSSKSAWMVISFV